MIRFLLALLSAILCILSFPNFDLGFLAWIALIPFLLALRGVNLPASLALSYLTGICYFMGVFFWVTYAKGVTVLHYSILGLYLGLYFPIFGLFFHLISSKTRFPFIVTAPSLWIGVEYLRSHAGFAALPMGLLAYTQTQNVSLIQMASFTGIYGVSFIIVLVNAAIADLIAYWIERRVRGEPFGLKSAPLIRGAVVLALILIVWFGGYLSLSPAPSGKPFSIGVVQGNIPPELRWKREYRDPILSKYENLSEQVLKVNPQLIIWPEAATPGFVLKNLDLYQRMVSIVRRLNKHLLVGSAEFPKFSKTLIKARKSGNTALFFSPEGKILGQYLKIYLLPFAEYVPYEGTIPWPDFIVSPSTNSQIAGTELNLFTIEGTKFGTLICSEMMFPGLSRRMVKSDAGFLVNISNEAWFGRSSYAYQFLSVCVFRAVENRVNVVRSTNTGVSSFIDAYGRITARLTNAGDDLFVEGTLGREIILNPPGSFYTKHGDILAYGCIIFSIGIVVWLIFKRLLMKEPKVV